MASRQTDSAPVRVLRLLELLCKHPVVGLANKDIAESLGYSRPNVCRDMDTLIAMGWAAQLDDGKYTVTPKPCSDGVRARIEAQSRQLL